ncbi:hypothetical protein Pla100_04640 [Neorhodopirellula pilleata]|uniref:SLA1 homology domain-containing protein n=2 Tax=Neorhodopirellula pilleata TaxID=2714738 RepID=A0A5C6AVM9_9BACT|nr:hypothetical protein Pla100_04640 [Neorhodopirellula pilleata]
MKTAPARLFGWIPAITVALATLPASIGVSAGDASCISFDLPPTAVAIPVSNVDENIVLPGGVGETVEVSLRLSSLVCGSKLPDIDRWMIRCVPRSTSWRVVDYAPRTETASEYASPIQIKTTDERSSSFGMSSDAAPIKVHGAFVGASGHMGFDKAQKHLESTQFDRQAPLHAVTAAGTIERGRGVYYKLRWTSSQVLEGEKEFKVTFGVPQGFRAGLLDVSVIAIGKPAEGHPVSEAFSHIPVLGEDQDAMRAIGQARFVVAVHAEGDPDAWMAAETLIETEQMLRAQAKKIRSTTPTHSLSNLIRHVASKLDPSGVDVHGDWVDRLIFENADPHTDAIIRQLPTSLRVLALDYCDARKSLQQMQTRRIGNDFESFRLTDLGSNIATD